MTEPGLEPRSEAAEVGAHGMHWPCLFAALVIMIGITLYPPLLTGATGKADHGLAGLLFMAMSAGFVRGVGFVPRATMPRWLFSAQSCSAFLLVAGGLLLLR